MRHKLALIFLFALFVAACWTHWLWAFEGMPRRRWADRVTPWHTGYYDVAWGMPTALVVPPNAEMQTNWGWGVGNTRITPLYHQFQRPYPGALNYDLRALKPVPPWPTDTTQYGVYSIRGPW